MTPDDLAAAAFAPDPAAVLTTPELYAAGLSKAALAALVRRRALVRVTAGFYALPRTLTSAQTLARLGRALERRLQGRAVLSHHTALAARGLPLYERVLPMRVAHLTYRRGTHMRVRSDHVLHRPFGGIPLTADAPLPLEVALLQCGSAWGERPFVVAADAALRARLVTTAGLQAALAHLTSLPTYPRLVGALARLDGRSESPGESLLRLALTDLGYRVESQVPVVTAGGAYRLDFAVVGARVAVEFDGLGKYDGPGALRAEKRREEDLRTADWEVVRFQWPDLDEPATVRRRMEWALARAHPR